MLADVDAYRRVELQRAAARGCLRVAEHDADLFAELVDEDERRFRFRDDTGELAQRLRHQARLQAHLRFAHLAFDFGLRHERGDGVDDDDIHAVGADEDFDNLERLLAMIGLRHEQVFEIDAELLRVLRIERVFRIDERGHAAQFLRFCDDLQRKRGLAGGFRPEDCHDPASRKPADAERIVDADRSRGDRLHWRNGATLSEAHDRSLAELFFDLADRDIDGAGAFLQIVECHVASSFFRGSRRWVTVAVTAETDPRNVPRESQAKIREATAIRAQ